MKREYPIVILISIAVLIFNNLPLITSIINQKDNLVFLGRRFINSQDVYTYVSFIEQSKQGRWLFENLYSSERQQPQLLRPSYLVIGKIAAFFNISSIIAYHISRIIFAIGFLVVLYRFISLFFDEPNSRILTFLLLLTSSGFGAILGKWIPESLDLWVPEAVTFLSLSEAPHFILSQLLMVSGFLFFLLSLEKNQFKRVFLSACSFLFLSLEHPFNIAVVVSTLTLTIIWLRRFSINSFLIIAAAILGVIYQIYEVYSNPVMKSWAFQNNLLSPDLLSIVSGYGVLWIFVFVGAERFLAAPNTKRILVLFWLVSTFVLLYMPVNFQRRFIEGLHIPMSIAAAFGLLQNFTPWFNKFTQKIAVFFFIMMLAATSVYSVFSEINIFEQDSTNNYYYHLPSSEIAALGWLRQNTTSADVILTNWFYGNLLPGMIGRKVYAGHKIQTPYFEEKIGNINRFLLSDDLSEISRFLTDNGITYIFLGKDDSMVQYGFKPFQQAYLTNVYNKEGTAIFKVEMKK